MKGLMGAPGTQKRGQQRAGWGEGQTVQARASWKWLKGVCRSPTDGPGEGGGEEREGTDMVTRKAVLRSLGFILWAVRSKEFKRRNALNTWCLLSASSVLQVTAQD